MVGSRARTQRDRRRPIFGVSLVSGVLVFWSELERRTLVSILGGRFVLLSRCRQLEPRLQEEAREAAAGLRPGREAVRLERERLPDGRTLVHNYGHGGCGVTLSWACAEDVLGLVEGAPTG